MEDIFWITLSISWLILIMLIFYFSRPPKTDEGIQYA